MRFANQEKSIGAAGESAQRVRRDRILSASRSISGIHDKDVQKVRNRSRSVSYRNSVAKLPPQCQTRQIGRRVK